MGNTETKLADAARQGNLADVRKLVAKDVYIDAKDEYGWTPLLHSAWERHIDVVRFLVEQGAALEAAGSEGWTPLIRSAVRGHLNVVRFLVEQGAALEAFDKNGKTPLMFSASEGYLKIVIFLVDRGASLNAADKFGRTPLMHSACRGHLEVVRYLMKQGAIVSTADGDGDTPLLYLLRNHFKEVELIPVVKLMLSHGASITHRNKRGKSAMSLVRERGFHQLEQLFQDHTKAEPSATTEAKTDRFKSFEEADTVEGLDVMDHQSSSNDSHCADTHNSQLLAGDNDSLTSNSTLSSNPQDSGTIQLLPEMDSPLTEQGVLEEAEEMNDRATLSSPSSGSHLNEAGYVVEQGSYNCTELLWATYHGEMSAMRYLIEQGADKEVKNKNGRTTLMEAVRCSHLDVVRYLVEQGADASSLDDEGNSALMHLLLSDIAKNEDSILPTAKLLLEHGAPPIQSNKQGKSAKSIARTKMFMGVIDLLDEYAVKPRRDPQREDAKWFIPPDAVNMTDGVLGQGGFGTVYLAKWHHIDVVVKEISVVELRRFLKEVKTWRDLTHDNVVPFYGANHRKEPYFIVSKYASKGELRKYLSTEKSRGRTVVWRKLREVAAGLSYLHQQGIVHGDLRGNNIVVAHDGTAMLTDFGLSFSESGSCSLKMMKDTLGAMAWHAPEFAMMTVETPTRKSDVFSLGMCIIEAVKDAAPWGACISSDAIRKIYRQNKFKIDKPAELTDEQWNLVRRMIAISPGDRPDLIEVMNGLEQFAEAEKNAELDRVCPY